MDSRNVCKFPVHTMSDRLSVSSFVLECKEVLGKKVKLRANRIILVVSGEGVFDFSGREVVYSTGNLVFGFKGETFSCTETAKTEYMYIDFEGLRADELFSRFSINSIQRSFSGFENISPLWKESLSRADEKNIDLATESVLLYTFSRIIDTSNTKNNLVNKMIEIIENNFTDTQLSLASIAEELSYNPKYLSQLFKKKVGVGYNEYLTSIRLKFAINLFDMGLDSVKNVAVLSGFSDPLYFSSVFKKATGLAPREYRAK